MEHEVVVAMVVDRDDESNVIIERIEIDVKMCCALMSWCDSSRR